jgi:hypothetical protein
VEELRDNYDDVVDEVEENIEGICDRISGIRGK